jgi:hypothetical protein
MNQKTIEILKVISNFILIALFILCGYYYITHTAEVNEALNIEKPTRLINIYEEKTGEYCFCVSKFEDIPLLTSKEDIALISNRHQNDS